MQSLRELVASLANRQGVLAAVLHGPDGLLIESAGGSNLAVDEVAALGPPVSTAATELGSAGGLGPLESAILEHSNGICLVSRLGTDVQLLVLLARDAEFGPLLFELRRNRDGYASLA